MAGSQEKTEKPSARRLDKARQEGQFPVSRELALATHFLTFLLFFDWAFQSWYENSARTYRGVIAEAFRADLTPARFEWIWFKQLAPTLVPLGAVALGLALFALLLHLILTRFAIATGRLKPAWNRLNPAAKLAELTSSGPVTTGKGILLVLVALGIFGWLLDSHFLPAMELLRLAPKAGISRGLAMTREFVWQAGVALLALGFVDWGLQRRRFMKNMRMTKQEVKQEHKESEGNPETKGRVRRMQREASRRSMMQDVPKATAVVVNPTHFAVAIRYNLESAGAPTVVAKGKNYLALRIREKATASNVPIVENPPLAQALYKSSEVGQEIPPHLYRAVAEILAYIFKLMNGRLPG